jgi:hypothetical protein
VLGADTPSVLGVRGVRCAFLACNAQAGASFPLLMPLLGSVSVLGVLMIRTEATMRGDVGISQSRAINVSLMCIACAGPQECYHAPLLAGESKRPVVESPWSPPTSECQRFCHPPRLDKPPL